MRILFLHEVNYLTKPIFEMHEFPEHLAERGHEVAFWHFPEGFSAQEVKRLGWKRRVQGRVIPSQQIALYTGQTLAGNLVGRIMTAIFGFRIARRIIVDFRPDVIVSLSVPTSGWQTLMVARKLSIPFIYRALDVSHKIRTGLWAIPIRVAEHFVIRSSSVVSSNGPAMQSYCNEIRRDANSVAIHLPYLDVEMFQKGLKFGVRENLGIALDQKLIMYMGSFFYFSGLEEVIKHFAKLDGSRDAVLVLVGGGDLEAELRSLVSKLGLYRKVLFTGYIPFTDLPNYLSAADVLINPMFPSLVSNTAMPNKVIQYLCTGAQVVSTRLSGLDLVFGDDFGIDWANSPSECIELALQSEGGAMSEVDFSSRRQKLKNLFGAGALDSFEHFLKAESGKS